MVVVKLFSLTITSIITKISDSYYFGDTAYEAACRQRFWFHNGIFLHTLGIFRNSVGKKLPTKSAM